MVILDNTNGKSWYRGKTVRNWWGTQHRDLDYTNEDFNDPASVNTWRKLGYTQDKFTGNMYDMRNSQPGWVEDFSDVFPWKYWSWSVYQMPPGVVLPNHQDTYRRFKELHNISDSDTIVRAVVFLEDWQSGHYLEIDNRGITNWKAGEYVVWSNDTPHLAANMGVSDRYTLQITGVRG